MSTCCRKGQRKGQLNFHKLHRESVPAGLLTYSMWTYPQKYFNINIKVLKEEKALTRGDLKFVLLSNFVFITILILEELGKPVWFLFACFKQMWLRKSGESHRFLSFFLSFSFFFKFYCCSSTESYRFTCQRSVIPMLLCAKRALN